MFYEVINRTIAKPISGKEVENRGLKQRSEVNVKGSYAHTYKADGPDATIEAVLIFERDGFNYIGERV